VRDRHAEYGHHRVADELLDRAAVVLEDASHLREVSGHDAPQRLRVEPLAEGRRTGAIREHDRDRLENLMRRLGLAEPRATRGESGRSHVRLTANAAYGPGKSTLWPWPKTRDEGSS
jgi:hypothetical protein